MTIGGRDLYLGRFGTPSSRAGYDRIVSEWLANGRQLPVMANLTIAELILRE